MKASVRDLDLLNELQPLRVLEYLRANGWREEARIGKGSYWDKSTQTERLEVLLPLDHGLDDFALRMAELLSVLEKAEYRSQPEILEDLLTFGADIIRSYLPSASGDGSITLDKGPKLYEETRNLMLAAACSAMYPKPVFPKRKPDRALEYIKHARFGPSKKGSYIITVISPVPPRLQAQGQLFDDDTEPFERRTVRILSEALLAINSATQEAAFSKTPDALLSAVQRGVSANLCEAILGMHEGGGERGIDFSFFWSPTRGTPIGAPKNVSLEPGVMPYLQEAIRIFKESSSIEGVEVIGIVHRMERSEAGGRVSIVGTVDGSPRSIVMDLEEPAHSKAVEAYNERLTVVCTGDLIKEGRALVLKNPRNFSIYNPESNRLADF
jgi:hypothetical protein